MMKAFGFCLTVAVIVLVACAGAPSPYSRVALWPNPTANVRVHIEPDVMEELETLADSARTTRREFSVCVASYGVLHTKDNSAVVVITALKPAAPYTSDSLNVWAYGPNTTSLCPGLPVVHTHAVHNLYWGRPSPLDSLRATENATVPFNLLVSVADRRPSKITVYWPR